MSDELVDTSAGSEAGSEPAPDAGTEPSEPVQGAGGAEGGQQGEEGASAAGAAPPQPKPDYLTREAFQEAFGQVSQQYQRQIDQMQQNMQQMQQALYQSMLRRRQQDQSAQPSLIPDPQAIAQMSPEGFHKFLNDLNSHWEKKYGNLESRYRQKFDAFDRERREQQQAEQYYQHFNNGIEKAASVHKELKDPQWMEQFKLAIIARTNLSRGDLSKVDIMAEANRIATLARLAKRAGPAAEAAALAQQNNASAAAGAPAAPMKGAPTRPGQKKLDFSKMRSLDDPEFEEMHRQLLDGVRRDMGYE